MKIPVDIRVQSERTFFDLAKRGGGNENRDSDDFLTRGTLRTTKNGFRIEFTEDNNLVTTIINTYQDNTVSINRLGPINSHMVFSDERTMTCICDTGFFPLQMLIRTKELNNSLTEDGGKLNIDYTVEIAGNVAENNKITFSVSPDISIIRS